MAKEDKVTKKVIIFVTLGFMLCCCGVKGDPEKPPSKLFEEQIGSN